MKYRVKQYGWRNVKSNLNGDNLSITVILRKKMGVWQRLSSTLQRKLSQTEDRTVLRYIRGSELIARNTDAVRTYYHYASDEMGSITHVTDEEGNLLNRYEYDAWGNLTAEEGAAYQPFYVYGRSELDAITQQYFLSCKVL